MTRKKENFKYRIGDVLKISNEHPEWHDKEIFEEIKKRGLFYWQEFIKMKNNTWYDIIKVKEDTRYLKKQTLKKKPEKENFKNDWRK